MNAIRKIGLLLVLAVCLPALLHAQRSKSPKWLEYDQRESMFPTNQYVMGFAADAVQPGVDQKELEKQLHSDARTQLIESIQVSIRSMAVSQMATQDMDFSNAFRRTSVSMSNIDLQGLQTETYLDQEKQQAFALTYAEKAKISDYYRNKIATRKDMVTQNLAAAAAYRQQNDAANALRSYYACMPLFREIEEAQTLIITFEGVGTDAPQLHFKAVGELKIQANQGIKSMQTSKDLSIDDASLLMAMGLKYQADSLQREIHLHHFTFQDTKMASSFSKRLTSSLESKLAESGLQVSIHAASAIDNVELSEFYLMVGTYWEEGENIKLIASIRNPENGKVMASTEALVSKAWLTTNGIKYKPDNYDTAVKDLVEFNNNEKLPSGGLLVDLATDRGTEGLIYAEGEDMKLYVRANKACYIRLIYHLADGQQVLLFDNYYISNDLANRTIEIPETFTCAEPFGVETLQLNAQTQEFAPLRIREENGYKFIVEELKDVLFKTRGFKPKTNLDAKTEKRMVITTMRN